MEISKLIRSIPDYPKPGVIFRDITTLLQNAEGFGVVVEELAQPFYTEQVTHVVGIEARGFIIGGAVAHKLSAGFVAIRKKGKLPWQTKSIQYDLEYGTDEVEIHLDSLSEDNKVLLIDDLIATGGTASAAARLIHDTGAKILGASFVIDLPDLGGRKKVERMGIKVRTITSFRGE
jgi:adenine phosphoribosyltransferase|tara:strand:- start:22284 stop:22811 length:528 start_codon:yes stop_codon:yes gene_type:complete